MSTRIVSPIIVMSESVMLTWKVTMSTDGGSPPAIQTSCGRGKCRLFSMKHDRIGAFRRAVAFVERRHDEGRDDVEDQDRGDEEPERAPGHATASA